MANEARLNELLDLVEQARREGDKETEARATEAYKRESVPEDNQAQYGGAGGYNPMLARIGGATEVVGDELGLNAENTANPIANAVGPLETAASAGTGFGGLVVGGLAGLGQGLWNMATPKNMEGMSGADRVRQVQDAVTYRPRTGVGAGMARVVSAPQEAWSAGTQYLGGKTLDATGSPLLAAAVETAGEAAPMALGAGEARVIKGARPRGGYVRTGDAIPTTADLKRASQAAYKEAEQSGVMVPAKAFAKSVDEILQMAKGEALNEKLHPKSFEVVRVLEATKGKDLTLSEAENLRKLALDAENDFNNLGQPTADARIAGKIVDDLDDKIEALSANSPARSLWAQSRRSQLIDNLVERAEIRAGAHYTQAGMEHSLRQEFKALALNPRRMKGLSEAQRSAIKKVANGGPLENTLRLLGKFDPTSGPIPFAAGVTTGVALAPTTGGASLVLPGIGFVSKRAATRATVRNVEKAREAMVGRGRPGSIFGPNGISPNRAGVFLRDIGSNAGTRPAVGTQNQARGGTSGSASSAGGGAVSTDAGLSSAETEQALREEIAKYMARRAR